MGWGFAIVVKKENVNRILDLLEKLKVEAGVIGKVSKKRKIIINYQNKKLIL
jgi:phosphoribosylaminoimidazole (AIR) synthetase